MHRRAMFHCLAVLSCSALFAAVTVLPAAADDQKPFNDDVFVTISSSCAILEVELGKIASTQAKSDDVKKFGKLMVDDHTKANEELKKAAKAAGLTFPTTLTKEDKKEYDRFKDYKGTNFDLDYVNHMVTDHQKGVAELTRASKEAKNNSIKEFATKTLPVVEGHLEKAKKLQEQIK